MSAAHAADGAAMPLPHEAAALAAAVLGHNLPAEAELELRLAGLAYQSDADAERHLHRAQVLAPDHPAVLIGLYRFYFYKNRPADALAIAHRCLLKTARDNALDPDWRRVEAGDADFGSYDTALPRFYLFALKAYAYLKLRLGHLDEGRDAALKILALDPSDKVGARVLLDDPEEMVRWNAVIRLPYRYLLRLRDDPHREVRIRVAARLQAADLVPMIDDPDWRVRYAIASRIDGDHRALFADDPDPMVREAAARRRDGSWADESARERAG